MAESFFITKTIFMEFCESKFKPFYSVRELLAKKVLLAFRELTNEF